MPKPEAKKNAAKKAKGNGQENMTWNAKTGGQENAVGNAKGKGKEKEGEHHGERPEPRRMCKEQDRQPSGHPGVKK